MAQQPSRVVVLGATGHAGQAVVRHALEQGREVTALVRSPNPESLRGLAVRVVQVDSELLSLADVAGGHDLLVDAAGSYDLDVGVPCSPHWTFAVEAAVRRTRMVVDAARRHEMKLAFISTYGTLPRYDSWPEADAVLWRRSVSPYYELKCAMEQVVIEASRGGLPAVIVNPVAFVGPWEFREVWNSLSLILSGRMPMVIDLEMSVIDVRDVAAAIDLAIAQDFFGRPIPLVAHNIHAADLVARVAALAGAPSTRPLAIPGYMAAWGAYWTSMAFATFGLEPPPSLGLIAITPEMRPLPRSAEQIALGLHVRPLDSSLRDAVAFYRSRRFS